MSIFNQDQEIFKEIFSFIDSNTIQLKLSLAESNLDAAEQIIQQLEEQNTKLYKLARKEGLEFVKDISLTIAAELAGIKKNKSNPTKYVKYIGIILNLVEDKSDKDAMPKKSRFHYLPVPSESIDMLGCSPLYFPKEWQQSFLRKGRIVSTLRAYDFWVAKGTKVFAIDQGVVTYVKVNSGSNFGIELSWLLFDKNTKHQDKIYHLEKYINENPSIITQISNESSKIKNLLEQNNFTKLIVALTDYFYEKMNMIILRHADNTYSQYVQIMDNGSLVEIDRIVKKGELIGFSGASGFFADPHLHVDLFRCKPGIKYQGERYISAQEENSLALNFRPEIVAQLVTKLVRR